MEGLPRIFPRIGKQNVVLFQTITQAGFDIISTVDDFFRILIRFHFIEIFVPHMTLRGQCPLHIGRKIFFIIFDLPEYALVPDRLGAIVTDPVPPGCIPGGSRPGIGFVFAAGRISVRKSRRAKLPVAVLPHQMKDLLKMIPVIMAQIGTEAPVKTFTQLPFVFHDPAEPVMIVHGRPYNIGTIRIRRRRIKINQPRRGPHRLVAQTTRAAAPPHRTVEHRRKSGTVTDVPVPVQIDYRLVIIIGPLAEIPAILDTPVAVVFRTDPAFCIYMASESSTEILIMTLPRPCQQTIAPMPPRSFISSCDKTSLSASLGPVRPSAARPARKQDTHPPFVIGQAAVPGSSRLVVMTTSP